MKIKKRYFWPMAVLGALLALFAGSDPVEARGGRGGGRGGGGRGGGGRGGGRGGSRGGGVGRGGGGGNTRNNNGKKEEQQRQRAEERLARVAAARIAYAKRERGTMYEQESRDRFAEALRRVLGGISE